MKRRWNTNVMISLAPTSYPVNGIVFYSSLYHNIVKNIIPNDVATSHLFPVSITTNRTRIIESRREFYLFSAKDKYQTGVG